MAQNITLLGASYSDCPAVLLPKTGGGTARFDDCTVVTATASDVASGKIFVSSNGTITTGTASGGGGGGLEEEHGTFTVLTDTVCNAKTILFSNTHTSVPSLWVICDAELTTFGLSANTLYSAIGYIVRDAYAHKTSASQAYYESGTVRYVYQTSNSVSSSTTTLRYLESSSISSLSSSNKVYHPRYYATETSLVLANSSTRYFRANRTYKWQAVW